MAVGRGVMKTYDLIVLGAGSGNMLLGAELDHLRTAIVDPVALVALAGAVFFAAVADVALLVAADLVVVDLVAPAVLVGLLAAVLVVFDAGTILGSFLAPLTTSLKLWPGRKRGTEVFFTLTVAPVAGLRAVRAARS